MISEDLGIKLENVTLDMLGKAKKVTITKEDTTIVDGAGKKAGDPGPHQPDQGPDRGDDLRLRPGEAAGAAGQARRRRCVIKVGGATEIEVKERKDRVDDALNATRAAVEEGIVPGGGVALLRAKKAVDGLKSDNPTSRPASTSCRKALEAPIRQIAENAGVDGSIVVGKVLDKSGNYGFDAQTEEYEDLVQAGIIDPTKVVRIALQDGSPLPSLLPPRGGLSGLPQGRGPPLPPCGGVGGGVFLFIPRSLKGRPSAPPFHFGPSSQVCETTRTPR